MKFWKEHETLRLALITLFFVAGVAAVVIGWKMTGKLLGLCIMLAGVGLLLAALAVYNKPFEEPKKK